MHHGQVGAVLGLGQAGDLDDMPHSRWGCLGAEGRGQPVLRAGALIQMQPAGQRLGGGVHLQPGQGVPGGPDHREQLDQVTLGQLPHRVAQQVPQHRVHLARSGHRRGRQLLRRGGSLDHRHT